MLRRDMWTFLVFIGTSGLFVLWACSVLWHLRWVRRLPKLEELANAERPAGPGAGGNTHGIRCSVVMAARNEEARIEQALRHLLAQHGVGLEFIIVDDRSTDRTGEILGRIEQEDGRVRVKRIDVLPDGWLGKCHACHAGAGVATGEWILFTDADCWLKPDVIARALGVAERAQADHITLASGLAPESMSLMASHLLFLISLASWFSGVNRDRPKSFMGIGAFNLVRAAAYRQCGGYETLRLTVVDDMKLGLLLRRAGKRTRGFIGADDVECHWGTTAWGMVKIMEKNYFAALDYRLGLVIAGTLFVMAVSSILVLGLVSGTPAGLAATLSPLCLFWPAMILARRLGWPWGSAILVPFMFPLFLYALLNSTVMTLRQGGIRWRETFYPLATLRLGNVSTRS